MHFRAFVIAFLVIAVSTSVFQVPSASATTDTYITPGSVPWVAPSGVTSVSVAVWGGGGGGGGSGNEGGGGGGGAYSIKQITVVPGNSYTVTVGAGGAGAIQNGTAGGTSWFSTTTEVAAEGGAGAVGRVSGAGGQAVNGYGDTRYEGGSGGVGSVTVEGGYGGGSSAGTGANGNDATSGSGGIAPLGGGNGGDGAGGSGLPGSNGSAPGGGGGGGGLLGTPGSGADGKVTITYTADTTAPTITNVTSDKANGTYTVGEIIDIDVTFSEAVTSTGNVTVTLETGTTDRTCTFTVSGSASGTCNYTVQAGDTSADLTVGSISGTIADAGANAMTNFVPATNLAANKAIVINTTGDGDTTAPVLLTFTSTTPDGTYGPGAQIVLVATYDETLGSESTITVTLDNGKKIPLSTVSGATVKGTYAVGATGSSESSSDLTVSSISFESVRDASGNTRTNSGVPENSHNLGDDSDIVIDTVAPLATTFTPASTSTGVSGSSNFVITFNEEVTAYSGNILIRKSATNAIVATVGVLTSQVTGVGTNTITINPSGNLADGASYYIQIPKTAFKDRVGNFYTGFSAKTIWSFATTGYLQATTFTPADNTIGVDVSSNFSITFNKPVFVSSANILIKRRSNNSTVATINATSTQVTGSGTNTITINPAKDLVVNTEYYFSIPATAFKDSAGSFYTGFTDKTVWNFTTGVGPLVQTLSPADNTTDVTISSDLILTFNKPVFVASANILIKRTSNDSTVAAINATSTQVTGSGTDTITINPTILLPENTQLYVQIPATAFRDSAGGYYLGIQDKVTWNFTTNAKPVVISLSPTDNATEVPVNSDLVMTFHKAVSAQVGDILILKASDGEIVEKVDVSSAQVTGSSTAIITINPASDLNDGTSYYIQIPATAFRDSEGNFFDGFVRSTVWNFSTACPWWNIFCAEPSATSSVSPAPASDPLEAPASMKDVFDSTSTSDNEPTPTTAPDERLIPTIVAMIKELIASPRITISKIRAALKPIVDSPLVKVVTTVAAAAAVVSVVASAGALASAAPSLVTQSVQSLQRVWQGLLSLLGFRRKKRPWGRVVDADSGEPLAGVYVQVYDHQGKQLKNTVISNDQGAFSSMVPPGMYEFRAQKAGWVLTPTAPYLHLLAGEHVFDGRPVTVTEAQLLPLVIAMRVTEEVPLTSHMVRTRVLHTIQLFIARISWPLLLIGMVLNSLAVFASPNGVNIAIEFVYVFLVAWKIWLHFLLKPALGLVHDADTNEPLDLAFVRVYNAENGRLIETRTTGVDGKFLLLPSPGVYTILVVRAGYESYRESHVVVNPKSEALAFSFSLHKIDSDPNSPPLS